MEVNVQSLSEVAREVEIKASYEELQPHFDKAYEQYRRKVEIRGFRKGRAPLDIIKKLYGELIEHESLEDIATEFYRKTVKEKELKPIGDPALTDMDFRRGESFSFKIRYDVRPEIILKEYKGIEIEKPIHTLANEEVEQELIRLRRSNATMQEVDEVTDAEHIVTADLQDIDSTGTPLIGKKNTNIRFYLADERLEQPFKDILQAAKKGGIYRVNFEHEHDGHTHTVNTELTVRKIEKMLLPELNDAFAEKITKGKLNSVEQLRSDIHHDLAEYWKQQSERQIVNALTAEIIRRHDFLVPESLTRSVLDRLLEEVKNDYPNKKLPDDFNIEKFNEENRAYAIYQSKWALLREELIKAENIAASDEDLEKLADQEAERIKIPKERLINYYKSSDQIKDRIVGDKLIKVLIASTKIKEVPDKK